MSSTIDPSEFRGFSRDPSHRDGLMHDEFAARCPPDVQPNTRIIAVCGVSDVLGYASPVQDGWFFSDFYLFHYLLRDTPTWRAGNQIWLTCCDPKDLVKKYGEYVHGPWKGDRRVVLDAQNVGNHLDRGNLRICDPKQLLERFISTIRTEIEIAKVNQQPVLILVFGHGDEGTYGISIGGPSQLDAPRLRRNHFESCLKKGVDVTLLVTSCYSGGWVYIPKLESGTKPRFNISAISGAGADNVSRSWAVSLSIGRRAGGGMLATCVTKALITAAENSKDFNLYCTDDENRITVTADGEAIEEDPTYVSLAEEIHNAVKANDPSFWDTHNISFAAQDDTWDKEWRARSGLPLLNYRQRWENLRRAPPGPEVFMDSVPGEPDIRSGGCSSSKSVSYSTSISNSSRKSTIGQSLSAFFARRGHRQYNMTMEKAIQYMKSHPGPNNGGSNMNIHTAAIDLINGYRKFDEEELSNLDMVLQYRMDTMHQAQAFIEYLELSFSSNIALDVDSWQMSNSKTKESSDPQAAAAAKERLARFEKIRREIHKLRLFRSTSRRQGPGYTKPNDYLAIALVEENLSWEETESRLKKLDKLLAMCQREVARTPEAQAVLQNSTVSKARSNFRDRFARMGVRLRSLSPSKSRRRPVVEEITGGIDSLQL